MDATLEERIRKPAPALASGYYLQFHPQSGDVVRYPKAGAFSLKPFCPPTGTPFGTYSLFFVRYATDTKPLPPANAAEPYPRIQIPNSKKSPLDQAISEFQKAAEVAEPASVEKPKNDEPNTDSPSDRRADLDFAIASTPAMITARADYEKQRMAMELAENNQDLLNKGNFSRDAAEALALSRAYRREAQVTIEAQANLARRTAEEVHSHWAAFRVAQEAQMEGMRLVKEQLEMFARPPPPPPATDYTPAIVEGLKTLRDFGVALVQTKAGVPLAPPPAPAPALPSQSATAKVTQDPPAAPPPAVTAVPPFPEVASVPGDASELMGELESDPAAPPVVAPVTSVRQPATPTVAGVIDPAHAKDLKGTGARVWKALAETSEAEAMIAVVSPSQLQGFLHRLGERVKR